MINELIQTRFSLGSFKYDKFKMFDQYPNDSQDYYILSRNKGTALGILATLVKSIEGQKKAIATTKGLNEHDIQWNG